MIVQLRERDPRYLDLTPDQPYADLGPDLEALRPSPLGERD
jgi:hypothetical protein